MNLQKRDISYILKEIIIVVVGVLIAVSINNFKENYDNRQYVNKTLAAIEQEIQQSKKDVEEVLQKHISTTDSIQIYLDNEQETVSELLFRLGGIQIAETKNIGLRFFISNKAELLDYEIISKLSEIETSSIVLQKKMDRLLDFTYTVVDNKDSGSKQKFLIYMDNVIDSEIRLKDLYDSFLETYKSTFTSNLPADVQE